jgi:class 3 adenylate cyclase/predicted ATPase
MNLTRLLSALTSYLPRHLLHTSLKNPAPGQPSGEFLSGTVLFADMSGFTAMSERLTALGREGAETLTTVINDFFGSMNDISIQHSGDLIMFGGDAMLLLFDGPDYAVRACRAAWRMQQAMTRFAEYRTPLGTFQLRMAAGLGSGPAFATALGSMASMHYTLMGPVLAAMGRAEALAGGGRIILDEATLRLAGDLRVEMTDEPGYFELRAEPTGAFARPDPPVLDLPPADDLEQIQWLAERLSVIVPFLPTGLLPRLLPDPAATLEGEHRAVTVVFVDFRDADALIEQLSADDPNAITPRLNAAFDAARAVVSRYEGVINKISTGPAGPHIIALFGAPTAHENDPERAVRTAIELQAALHQANLPGVHPARIGINTGFVYAANVGSRARREYTVMGDQVNLAARLMTAARPGQIIISASTAARVERAFDLDEREPVRVKGKAQPQRNFLVQGVRAQSTRPPSTLAGQLLGRANEAASGYQRVELARQGQGQIIAVSGEAGVGKSRFVEALAEQARTDDFDLVSSVCISYGGTIPYSVWLEPVQTLLDFHSSDSDDDRIAKLQAALDAIDRGDDGPILGDIIGVPLEDSVFTASLDAQARQRRLFDTIVELIRHSSERQPLLWIVDDAHWIDPASVDLLNHLARRVDDAAIALVVSYRTEGGWTGWRDLPNATEIVLPLLDRAASEALVADLLELKDRQLPLAVQSLMARMASGTVGATSADSAAFETYWGNPFFTGERIRALIDSGVLARDEAGHWQVTRPIESIEMPDTIHGVIMSRIDRLPEPARRILQVAAVIGRAFDVDVLQAVAGGGEDSASLQRHLHDLSDLGVLPSGDGSPEEPTVLSTEFPLLTSYVFRNVTTQEVAYGSLRYERRRELHRRIGEFIESHPALADDLSGLLTYHYFEGQLWDKVLPYALEAGQSAQEKYANAAAAGAYRRALQAAESLSPPRAAEQLAAHESLADVLLIVGEYDEVLQHYARARNLAGDDLRHLADLCRKTAETHERRSAYEEAFSWLSRGLQYAAPDSLEAARIYLMGAGVYHRQGKHDKAAEWCEKTLDISRALVNDAARQAEARALYLLAGIYHKRGDLKQAIEAAQRAVTVYQLAGDMLGQSQALNTLAVAYTDQGDFVSAARYFNDTLELKERIGDVAGRAMIMLNLGDVYRLRGELAKARLMFEQSLHIYQDLRYTLAVALLHNNLAATAIAAGDWGQAVDHLAESEKLFDTIGSDDFKAELQRHRAELSLGRGEIAEALIWAQQATAVAEASQEKLEIGLTRRVLGQVYLAQDNLKEAERELLSSLEILQSVGSKVEEAGAQLALAQLRRRQNRLDEAWQLVSSAIGTYQLVGAAPLVVRAQAELAANTPTAN